jgi:mono/diheme cytochrome c family protein
VTSRAGSTATDSTTTIYSAATLPIPELGYTAREGRVLYRHYCMNCHGDEGKGDGFNAFNLDPKPRSLADSTFQATHTDADLLAAIRSGGSAVGLSTAMPPWGRTLNERQTQHVVEYLRTLTEKKEHASP